MGILSGIESVMNVKFNSETGAICQNISWYMLYLVLTLKQNDNIP